MSALKIRPHNCCSLRIVRFSISPKTEMFIGQIIMIKIFYFVFTKILNYLINLIVITDIVLFQALNIRMLYKLYNSPALIVHCIQRVFNFVIDFKQIINFNIIVASSFIANHYLFIFHHFKFTFINFNYYSIEFMYFL